MDLLFDLESLSSFDWSVDGLAKSATTMAEPRDSHHLAAAIAQAESLMSWALDEESEKLLLIVEAFVYDATVQKTQWDEQLDGTGSVVEPEPLKGKRERAREALEAEKPKRVRVVFAPPQATVTLVPAVQWDFQKVRIYVLPSAFSNDCPFLVPNVVRLISVTIAPLRLEFSARPSRPGNHASVHCFANEAELLRLDLAETVSLRLEPDFLFLISLADQTKQTKAAIHRLKRALCVFSGMQALPLALQRVLVALQWGHKGIKNMTFEGVVQ
jgi:hypothetical protein